MSILYGIFDTMFKSSNRSTVIIFLCISLIMISAGPVTADPAAENTPAETVASTYQPNWESIDSRPLPDWFGEAKFGIFVVWGPYSVPGWKDHGYAEWYGNRMRQKNSATWKFHNRVYGENFPYEKFAKRFTAEMWDPDAWCDLFVRAGAKYVVTTANYHDGFAMWPTELAATDKTDVWNSMAIGPKRDIIGNLKAAGDARGLKMGIYYSLYEWYHPLWLKDQDRFVTEIMHPKFKEVVTKYKPWFIFLDGEWSMDYRRWKTEELAAWLYNESPCKDYVITNDRWGQCRGSHGDVFSSEYGGGDACGPEHPWQEDRGMGHSYGYNRAESIEDYDSAEEMIQMLCRCTSGGGNYLLCVGPTGDGRIPVIMQERLLQIGEWLKKNGEAIYGAQPSPFYPRRFDWGAVSAKPGKIYLMVYDASLRSLDIRGLKNKVTTAYMLADPDKAAIPLQRLDDGYHIAWTTESVDPAATVIVLEIEGEPEIDRAQYQYADRSIPIHCRSLTIHGEKAKVYFGGYQNRVSIVDWTDPRETVSCELVFDQPGNYNIDMKYACPPNEAGSRFKIDMIENETSKHSITAETQNTGSATGFKRFRLGSIAIDKPGRHTLSIQPIASGWKNLRIQSINISP